MAIIDMQAISWVRQQRTLLNQIDWQVKPKEQWVILGLNGSGKTSLLNLISGYNYPTSGQMKVLGETFGRTNLSKLRERIGIVSSGLRRFEASLNQQTVYQLVLSGKFASIGLHGHLEVTPADKLAADCLLAQVGVMSLKHQYFHQLSQGEQTRVLIARSLMAKPDLLILDEPCSGLDIRAREELLLMIEDLSQSTTQILYVTHYIEEITPGMTHVLLLKDGQVIQAGVKEEVLTDDLLSETFQVPVTVHWAHDRPYLTIDKA